jgi:hypothetical protein
VLPGGSTNVFARILGVPNDPVPAADLMADAIKRESTRRVGLGSVNGRYFLFHVGIGFDAAVVEQVERRSELKRYAGHPLFVYAAFVTWFRHYDRRRPRFGLTPRGEAVPDGYFTIVLNCDPYTISATGPCHWRPGTSTGDWWPSPSAPCGPGPCSAPSAGPCRGTPVAPSRRIDVRTDLAGVEVVAEAVPVPGRRRLPGRHPPPVVPPRARCPRPRDPLVP